MKRELRYGNGMHLRSFSCGLCIGDRGYASKTSLQGCSINGNIRGIFSFIGDGITRKHLQQHHHGIKAASSSTTSAASGLRQRLQAIRSCDFHVLSVSTAVGRKLLSGYARCCERRGWGTTYTDNISISDYVNAALTDYADQGYQLIFAPQQSVSGIPVNQVSDDYPGH